LGESEGLVQAAGGEQVGGQAQAMAGGRGLQAVAQHGADAHQAVTVAQQRQDFAAGGCRDVDGRKLLVEQEVQQQASVATIVLLPAASALADGQGVTDQQVMTELFEQPMEPQRVTGSFHAYYCGSC